MRKKSLIFILSVLVFSSCAWSSAAKNYELEEMEQDVLKNKTGVDIRITPVKPEANK